MEPLKDGESVKSPFIDLDNTHRNNAEQLSKEIEEELTTGLEQDGVVNEALLLYDFGDAVNSEVENQWLKDVSVIPMQNLSHVKEEAQQITEELKQKYPIDLRDNFGLDEETRLQLNQPDEIQVRIGDLVDRTGDVRVYDGEQETTIPIDNIEAELPQHEFDVLNDSGASHTHQVEYHGQEFEITPDLNTGWFNIETTGGESRLWVPYADQESAIIAYNGSNGQETTLVTFDESRTGEYFVDAFSEGLQNFLPFWDLLSPKISSDAVDYATENNVFEETRDIEIRQDAWNELKDGRYEHNRVRDRLYRLAAREDPQGLFTSGIGGVDYQNEQIGSEDRYMEWHLEDDDTTVVLDNLYPSRKDAINQDTRT